jgi:hypothetical protein
MKFENDKGQPVEINFQNFEKVAGGQTWTHAREVKKWQGRVDQSDGRRDCGSQRGRIDLI